MTTMVEWGATKIPQIALDRDVHTQIYDAEENVWQH